METQNIELERYKMHQTQLRLQFVQVFLSSILLYFIVKNSMKKQNLPDTFIEDEEE